MEESKYNSFIIYPKEALGEIIMIIDLNVTKFYQSNYRPIVFTVDAPQLFDATLVMATLAEQHRDDIPSKDDSNILNASESDVHISTQQSINKERNDAAQNVDSYRSPNISNQKPPFVLSSRVEFDEGSLFSAARKDMTSKENQGETHDIGILNPKTVEPGKNNSPTTNERKPSTPLSKKAKYIFKRTFDATFKPSDICGTDIILASDSENDETD